MTDDRKEELSTAFDEIQEGLGEAMCDDDVGSFKMTQSSMGAAENKDFAKLLIDRFFEIEGIDSVTDE